MNYQMGAFEALHWAWSIAKEYDDCVHCRDLQKLRDHIQKILLQLPDQKIDFALLLKDYREGNW